MTFDDFKNRLAHSYVAYRYAVAGVPAAPLFARGPVHVGGFHFENEGHATSMLVELGWAFFVRLEAVLENFCSACGQGVARDALIASMEASGKFSNHELEGLAQYRDLRNSLHHDDGQPDPKRKNLAVSPGNELRLLPSELQVWHDLFLKVGEAVWVSFTQRAQAGSP